MATQTLVELSHGMTVRQIMVPASQLERADTYEEARSLHRRYDVVPVPKSGRISGYFLKDTQSLQPVNLDVLIGADTAIVDLPGLFRSSPYYFIIAARRLVGFVHVIF